MYFLVQGTDTVSIMWYLSERVSMCWEWTDFCDVRQLADGQFSQSVCFLTRAPVSQVWTLRLCAIFLERRAAPPQEEWRPSLINRSGLHQKLFQLSIKPMLFCGHHLDIQPLSDNSLLWISSPRREGARAYYSVWHRTCKFTHLFNIIFSDLRLAESNIINECIIEWEEPVWCSDRNGRAVFWPVTRPPHSHTVALLQSYWNQNRTMYRTPWASRIQSSVKCFKCWINWK